MSFLRHAGFLRHEGFKPHEGLLSQAGFLRTSGPTDPPYYDSLPVIAIAYTATPGTVNASVVAPGVWNDADTVTDEWYINGNPTGLSGATPLTGLKALDTVYLLETAINSAGEASASSEETEIDPRIYVLAAWYDASYPSTLGNSGGTQATDGQKIASWADRTGSGVALVQTTDANRPTLDVDGLNGHPTLLFDGTNDAMIRTVVSGSLNYTLLLVLQSAVTTQNCPFYNGNSAGDGYGAYQYNGHRTMLHGGTGLLEDGNLTLSAEIWGFQYGSSSLAISVNGVQATNGALGLFGSPTASMNVGTVGSSDFYSGKISAVLLASRKFTDLEVQQTADWFKSRYSIL